MRAAFACLVAAACAAPTEATVPCPSGMIEVPGPRLCLDRAPVDVRTFSSWAEGRPPTTAERSGGVVFVVGAGFRLEPRANHRAPFGDGVAAPGNHPVTQLTALEAEAHCADRGARLPTAGEWERAARGGGAGTYPWGDAIVDARGAWRANVWQGVFPAENTLDDGFLFTSPIGSFPPTPLGFLDLVGNVWQWTATEASGDAPPWPSSGGRGRAIVGGSFLCEAGRCHGYRIGARQRADEAMAFVHVGVRCALSPR